MNQNGYNKLQSLLQAGCKVSHLHMRFPEARDTYVILLCPDGRTEVVVAIDDQDGVKIAKRAMEDIKA